MKTILGEVRETRVVKYKCRVCGKSKNKTLSDYMICRFNRNPDGYVCEDSRLSESQNEIRVKLNTRMDEQERRFLANPICKACDNSGRRTNEW
jgi:hypothetical protein